MPEQNTVELATILPFHAKFPLVLPKPEALPQNIALKQYINSIGFHLLKPQTAIDFRLSYTVVLQLLSRLGISFEVLNTILPPTPIEVVRSLTDLSRIPKASTFALGAIINKIVSQMELGTVFLNVGVWQGFTYLSGLAGNGNKMCIGVDNFSVNRKVKADGSPEYKGIFKYFYKLVDAWTKKAFLKRFDKFKSGTNHRFYEMDYVEYFKTVHKDTIGFYIYDAQHRYTDQLRALKLAEPFFSKNCIILIDDTNAPDNRQATLDFIEQSENRYEMLCDVQTFSNRHPTLWNGVMIFRKIG